VEQIAAFSLVTSDQVAPFAGLISIVGLALIGVYNQARVAARTQNLADAEAQGATWKGKYEAEIEATKLLRRRVDDLTGIAALLREENERLRQRTHEEGPPT
jgi:hypothetical protein